MLTTANEHWKFDSVKMGDRKPYFCVSVPGQSEWMQADTEQSMIQAAAGNMSLLVVEAHVKHLCRCHLHNLRMQESVSVLCSGAWLEEFSTWVSPEHIRTCAIVQALSCCMCMSTLDVNKVVGPSQPRVRTLPYIFTLAHVPSAFLGLV